MNSEFMGSAATVLVNPKVLLIDLENCPSQLHHLPNDLANYIQVVICYAQSSSKVPLNWLTPLSTAIAANKLKIQKMERVSKNSADFGLFFFAGALMQELPKETHFVIVSNDTDLDHAVHLLKSQGRSAERVCTKQEEKEQPKQTQQNDPSTPLAQYCSHLVTYSKNRPGKTESLLNSIKSKFNNSQLSAESIYQTLVSSGAVKETGSKVTYIDKKIKELAAA